jgi:SAM-dependent methyltransferase
MKEQVSLEEAKSGVTRRLKAALACCQCGSSSLDFRPESIVCATCEANYVIRGQQLDLRPTRPRTYAVEFEVGPGLAADSIPWPESLASNPSPEIGYASVTLPRRQTIGNRLTPELLSYLPHHPEGGLLLDIGCGPTVFRDLAALTGLEYVGIDHEGDAPILADAHCLPFADESVDLVISFAVLEHIRYPFVAMKEIARVMKAGSRFLGSVAFLEPYHGHSYYHASHLGTHDLLTFAGLEVEQLSPNQEWSALRAQARMGLLPKTPLWLSNAIVQPLDWLSQVWWAALARRSGNGYTENKRMATSTGGFRFVCRKPD